MGQFEILTEVNFSAAASALSSAKSDPQLRLDQTHTSLLRRQTILLNILYLAMSCGTEELIIFSMIKR